LLPGYWPANISYALQIAKIKSKLASNDRDSAMIFTASFSIGEQTTQKGKSGPDKKNATFEKINCDGA
jgi:hypothetical protein